jgi:voltage-gated potassium channel
MPERGEPTNERRRRAWESRTEWPLLVASVAYLFAYSWLVLDREIAPALLDLLLVVIFVVWAALILDFIARVLLTPRRSRWTFVRHNKVDLLSAIVPVVRPFRLVARLRRVRGFRGGSGNSLRSRLLVSALLYAVLFVYVEALSVYAVERGAPGATLVSFGNTVWWACVTIATVGYGDFVPVTVPGRILAVMLMAGGLAIIGTASATIVSYLSERIAKLRELEEEDSKEDGRN